MNDMSGLTRSGACADQRDMRVVGETGQSVRRHDRIFVRDYVRACEIGAYSEERGGQQDVSFSVEAYVDKDVRARADRMDEVSSYDDIIKAIDHEAGGAHINLVETLAERIAARCLRDQRLDGVRVRVEKLERGPAGVGCEIERWRDTK